MEGLGRHGEPIKVRDDPPDGALERWLTRCVGRDAAEILSSFLVKAAILLCIAALSLLSEIITRTCLPGATAYVLPVTHFSEAGSLVLLGLLVPFEVIRYVVRVIGRGALRGRRSTR